MESDILSKLENNHQNSAYLWAVANSLLDLKGKEKLKIFQYVYNSQ